MHVWRAEFGSTTASLSFDRWNIYQAQQSCCFASLSPGTDSSFQQFSCLEFDEIEFSCLCYHVCDFLKSVQAKLRAVNRISSVNWLASQTFRLSSICCLGWCHGSLWSGPMFCNICLIAIQLNDGQLYRWGDAEVKLIAWSVHCISHCYEITKEWMIE